MENIMSTKKVRYYCKKCETHGSAVVPKSFSEGDTILFIFEQHRNSNNTCIPQRDNFVFSNSFNTCLERRGIIGILFESTSSKLMKMITHRV